MRSKYVSLGKASAALATPGPFVHRKEQPVESFARTGDKGRSKEIFAPTPFAQSRRLTQEAL